MSMSDEPQDTPDEPKSDATPSDASAKPAKPKAKAKKGDSAPKASDAAPEPAHAETPVEPPSDPAPAEPVPVEPAPDTTQPSSVLDELSERAEEPGESRNELVFDPSSGELVVKPKGEAAGSDAVIVSDIADEGFFAQR